MNWRTLRRQCVALVTLGLLAGCDLPGKPDPDERPVPADRILNFNLLYKENCSGCHGADGKLGPAPPLNDAMFLQIVPDAVLHRVIREGRSGTPMPAFLVDNGGPLTAEQVKVLAEGIKPRWASQGRETQNLPKYLAESNEAAAKPDHQAGKTVYARACAGCHGADGEGGQWQARTIGGLKDRAFLALISDQGLRRLTITGRPDLGMPTFAESTGRSREFQSLTAKEIQEVVALLASWRTEPTRNMP